MDAVQREFRNIKGVTALIYVQTCATEKRRRRKRGIADDPDRFVMINPLVCEGCGDCSVESNCLSVEPLNTPFGRKRKINQSTCNKDFSCLNGFCPSFVTVEGGTRRKLSSPRTDISAQVACLTDPAKPTLDTPFDLLITGVGGTGVVTIGALVTMAAHLEGKGVSVLDFTGFAQKFGTVLSYVRLAEHPDQINQVRIDERSADAVIGCDVVVSSSPKASLHYGPATQMVLNTSEMPTGDVVLNRDADLKVAQREASIRTAVSDLTSVSANSIAEQELGDAVFANMIMLGLAWQKGLVPVSKEALTQAIRLNGVAIEMNCHAFDLGRVLADYPEILSVARGEEAETVQNIISTRAAFLEEYQNKDYSDRFKAEIDRFASALPDELRSRLVPLAARSLFKVMAYKDEYEVARLHTETGFEASLANDFEGPFRITHHLAPPLLSWRSDGRGRPVKRAFGPWVRPLMRGLARMRWLRGTVVDPFGYLHDRRTERGLINWYEAVLQQALDLIRKGAIEDAETLLSAPLDMRGYGPVKDAAIIAKKTEVAEILRGHGL